VLGAGASVPQTSKSGSQKYSTPYRLDHVMPPTVVVVVGVVIVVVRVVDDVDVVDVVDVLVWVVLVWVEYAKLVEVEMNMMVKTAIAKILKICPFLLICIFPRRQRNLSQNQYPVRHQQVQTIRHLPFLRVFRC